MPTQPPIALSVVVPMYNEEQVCGVFFAAVVPVLERITANYEIICVNDGSRDNTLQVLREARDQNNKIKIIDLSRNFGKEPALTAGLDFAQGAAVIPIDADLQDPPEVIPQLVAKWREGYDMVLAKRNDRRGDSALKRLTARLFYRLLGRIGDIPIPTDTGDFRLLDRKVVDVLSHLPERTRFMKGLFAWPGFKQAVVSYSRPARAAGASKWTLWHLWNLALEGVVSFSTLPLRIWTYVGLLMALFSLSYISFIVGRYFIFGVDVPGYASLIVVMLFFNGLTLIGLGILGEYLARIFIEVKQRPLYLIRETVGFNRGDADARGDRESSIPIRQAP